MIQPSATADGLADKPKDLNYNLSFHISGNTDHLILPGGGGGETLIKVFD